MESFELASSPHSVASRQQSGFFKATRHEYSKYPIALDTSETNTRHPLHQVIRFSRFRQRSAKVSNKSLACNRAVRGHKREYDPRQH